MVEKIEKAEIIVLKKNGNIDDTIPVMFNPKEYTVSTVSEIKGEGSKIQFKRVSIQDFTVSLFFDTYEDKTDVRDQTQKIVDLLKPTVEGKKIKQPPVCLFSWGKFRYKGIIHKIDQKFILFLPIGIPVRSELTVTFKSVVTTEEDAKLKGNEACRKVWTVKSGDRLDLIAYTALKDASLWKKIADENNIDDPLAFPDKDDIGKVLMIPD